ncbi:MAG: hypothetical protein R3C19_22180 [Planctomycetaceae bacterium]
MRLTLRTLLAYLDDRLSPVNAREIGQKITTSPFATELADRIKDVVRKRRLSGPGPQRKVIDANLIAEYLDDQLTPELVALIEKEILSSDFSLAEVAASHQILGLLKDNVELDSRVRERLYALDPHPAARGAEPAAAMHAATDTDAEEWKPLAPVAGRQRRSAVWLLAVLVVGWLALILTDSNLFRGGTKPELVADAGGSVDEGSAPVDDTAAPDDATAGGTQQNTATVDDAATAADGGNEKTSDESTGDDVAVVTSGSASDAEAASAADSDHEAVATAEPKPTEAAEEPEVADADAAEPAEVEPPPAHRFSATDRHSMAAVWNPESGGWSLVTSIAPLSSPDWSTVATHNVIGVFEPFELTMAAVDSGWSAIAQGPALLRGISHGVAGLELLEGRMVIRRDPTSSAQPGEKIPFRLAAGNSATELTLLSEDTVVGVEVVPLPQLLPIAVPSAVETGSDGGPAAADGKSDAAAPANDPAADEDLFAVNRLPIGNLVQVNVYSAEGSVLVALPGDQPAQEIAKGRMISWIADATSVSTVNISPPGQLGVIPEWIYSLTSPPIAELEELRMRLSHSFTQTTSLSMTAAGLTSDRNPQIAKLAAGMLALTRDIDQLLGLLLKSDSENVRRAAIDGLRKAMYQKESNQVLVARGLENRLPVDEIEGAMRLLKGVSRVAAEERDTSAWLVGMLESDRAAIRELAIYNLERITDERYSFYADADPSRRNEAVRRWQRHLSRNDGILVHAP